MQARSVPSPATDEQFELFCAHALPDVFGYLLPRSGGWAVAEDLTSETFAHAVRAHRAGGPEQLTVGWLIVVARRRLVDHWRRREREDRSYRMVEVGAAVFDPGPADGSETELDVQIALAALERLGGHHRAALTLRYLDGLPVAQVACELGRGLHATEALLQRARRALRRAYEEVQADA